MYTYNPLRQQYFVLMFTQAYLTLNKKKKKMCAGMTTILCTVLSLYLHKVYQLYAGHVFESKRDPSRPGE